MFEHPEARHETYQVVIGVFNTVSSPKSTKQFFYSKKQLLAFLDSHAAELDRESIVALTAILNHSTLPFDTDRNGHAVVCRNSETFFVLANCLDKLSASPPANPIYFLPL